LPLGFGHVYRRIQKKQPPLTGTRVKALLPELKKDSKERTEDHQGVIAEDWLPLRTTAFGAVGGAFGRGFHCTEKKLVSSNFE
jgi:hypothetical protein